MAVSEQIIQVIDALCEKFGIAVDWTSQNIIPYVETLCEKLFTYEIVTSIAWMVIMVLLSIGSIIAAKKLCPILKRKMEEDRWSDFDVAFNFAIGGTIFVNIVFIIVFGMQIMDIIKCLTFPEMYVFQYINTLIQ